MGPKDGTDGEGTSAPCRARNSCTTPALPPQTRNLKEVHTYVEHHPLPPQSRNLPTVLPTYLRTYVLFYYLPTHLLTTHLPTYLLTQLHFTTYLPTYHTQLTELSIIIFLNS